jgi:hypothetical protein
MVLLRDFHNIHINRLRALTPQCTLLLYLPQTLLMERPIYKEAVIVPYRLPFEDDISDLRVRAEFDRDFRQHLLHDDYFYAIFKRKYFYDPTKVVVDPDDDDSPAKADLAIWMMHRAIANRTKLAIAQKERLGKYIHLMNVKEQWRVQQEVNLEIGYMVQYLGPDMPDFAELNSKLFASIVEDLTENNPCHHRPTTTLVED